MIDEFKFKLNNKIEIEMKDGFYKSIIQDVTDEYVAINIPVKDGRFLPLTRNEKIRALYFYDKNIYCFETEVVGKKMENIFMILLKLPTSMRKIQRRNFVRVSTLLKIWYNKNQLTDTVNSILNIEQEAFPATVIDISGGGMRIRVEQNVKSGEILILTVPIKDESITIKGKVIRAEKEKTGITTCGITFMELDNIHREKIIKLVFETMREQRTKGSKEE